MRPSRRSTRGCRPLRRIALLLLVAVVAAGCGAVGRVTSGNPAHGEALFKMATLPGGKPGCASCHTLAAAGTTGTIGPNLDDAFAADKSKSFVSAGTVQTIRDVVRGQIAYADSDPGTTSTGMPADLLTGQDAKDVAVFVAQCAAVPHCKVGTTPASG